MLERPAVPSSPVRDLQHTQEPARASGRPSQRTVLVQPDRGMAEPDVVQSTALPAAFNRFLEVMNMDQAKDLVRGINT